MFLFPCKKFRIARSACRFFIVVATSTVLTLFYTYIIHILSNLVTCNCLVLFALLLLILFTVCGIDCGIVFSFDSLLTQ